MNNDADYVAPLLEVWGRRTLTISGCLLIRLFLLTSFPLMLIAGAIIDLSRGEKSRRFQRRVKSERIGSLKTGRGLMTG